MDSATTPGSVWALYRRALARNAWPIVASCLLLSLWQVCEAAVPIAIGVVIDRAVATGATRAAVVCAAGLCLLFVVLSLSYRFGSRAGFGAVQRESHALRVEVAARALHPRGSAGQRLPGETLSLATADADLAGLVIRNVAFALASSGAIVVSGIYLLSVDLTVGLVVLLGVPAVLGLLQLLTPLVWVHAGDQQEKIGRATAVATDLVSGLRVLKGIGGERTASRRYAEANSTARDASIRTARSVGLVAGVTTLLSGTFLAVVALVAGRAALSGEISIGELIAIVGVAQHLADPVQTLGQIAGRVAVSVGAARRVVGFLASPPLIDADDEVVDPDRGGLVLEDVVFGPLHGIDLEVPPGLFFCIVVDDQAAADALVAILAGEVSTTRRRGRVLVGGRELSRLRTESRREHLVVCHHLADLFEGTLRSNVIGDRTLGEPALAKIIDRSGLEDLVASHPAALDRGISATGSTLSGGQRQRVAFARALAIEPPVLVLHEPTTAVDALTEYGIGLGLREHRHAPGSTQTTIVITSSPAYLAVADQVAFVADGRVRRIGDHATLQHDRDYREVIQR